MLKLLKTTDDWKEYWVKRKIDWRASYSNWDHPHRYMISAALGSLVWTSLFEIGCGAGANLGNILRHFKNKQLGGIDINPEAIAVATTDFTGGMFKVGSAEDIMLSDSSTDIVLSDMCLIYIGPRKIDKVIEEMKRIGRNYIVLCELHHSSFLKRLWLRWTSGYNAYDYRKLLRKHGFYNIDVYKIPDEYWPGGNPQKTFGYITIAKIPRRK